ncbi:2-amino-4-hydroxy-6-hydroxymethyldihydropteridine diphosphokinase [Bordetella holmesii]|uniref:2-amino-4-hydroxy-6-hydroxymethyldihydropteridine pyrophosphokinase n=2 Tax=Bordetella holmesii TaxID=35814 RepID=A0A158M5N1_9BORD|nr:2-amino-4-hydroxy-6-hydroxymethyldihydropteridine diphosphokinase [Bordetella holmesii]AHV92987.1 2-amino-4-hydroxy-6-hydroxymethyldihydropteridine diphosphokinase [Bordetella holmesii ATCC 51541]AIT25679.1 2-amino-4-hydroxy-6-hydroxymethyldihydropteridine diphosphokinase [Bordetella holmesii 44057]EWM41501.1 2-amino-4-hydroxy-6-hydroxymethyldihydropteridine diphosphokinase [Bordetella holmesii 41130]EWM46247.1 2-amino-4-hydroxy-6-hydroxymethyldihydropteridine diphosphokinase [Bordetella hol
MSSRAYVGLGANLGDGAATLRQALTELAALPGVQDCRSSPLYRSAPVDATGPDFINAVAALQTTLTPLGLLDALQAIEQRHDRQRPYRNAPRTLDLDLLMYDDLELQTTRLILPHPRLHERAFVLYPLRDLAPDLRLPQGSYADLLHGLQDQGIARL